MALRSAVVVLAPAGHPALPALDEARIARASVSWAATRDKAADRYRDRGGAWRASVAVWVLLGCSSIYSGRYSLFVMYVAHGSIGVL
jgi:hypothetical protein